MKKKKLLILDKEKIAHKLRRMAFEIWELNANEDAITLVGVEKGGKTVADVLGGILQEISPLKIEVLSVSINKRNPLNHALTFEDNLTDRAVVIVDDVANSGKTLAYSLHALLSYDLRKVMVAVLVDRKHKSFPIACDIVGQTLATTIQEHIEVEISDKSINAVYLTE